MSRPSLRSRQQVVFSDSLLAWRDSEGRFLGESAAPGFQASADLARCPYAGERRDGTMNLAALRQVERHWPAVLAGLQRWSGPTAGEAWLATCRLRWAPVWTDALDGEPLEPVVAAGFKTALGLNRPLTAWLMLDAESAARPLPDAATLNARLEREGWLHGRHQVCAAPPRRLAEAWKALAGGGGGRVHPADSAARWVAGSWAVLGATRRLLRAGVLDEGPGWSPVEPARPDWPDVVQLLREDGPGALVREVSDFEPAWALRVWTTAPDGLPDLVETCTRARTLSALDAAWSAWVG